MERVSFLLESTGDRLSCLLNPESVVVRRLAGVAPRRSLSGQLAGAGMRDDPLIYTGGGRTELELDLLFDVSLAPVDTIDDVRQLTSPLWDLAENRSTEHGQARVPTVRFVWGKTWNVPAVVRAAAERLENFAASGVPRRSWLRLRLWRVEDLASAAVGTTRTPSPAALADAAADIGDDRSVQVHEVVGGDGGERLDELAARYYGDPGMWRFIATVNGLGDAPWVAPGRALRIPPLAGGAPSAGGG